MQSIVFWLLKYYRAEQQCTPFDSQVAFEALCLAESLDNANLEVKYEIANFFWKVFDRKEQAYSYMLFLSQM